MRNVKMDIIRFGELAQSYWNEEEEKNQPYDIQACEH